MTLKIKIFFSKWCLWKGNRLNLNFGHTFGHAIEMATDKLISKDYFRHGEAVGLVLYANCIHMGRSQLLKFVKVA